MKEYEDYDLYAVYKVKDSPPPFYSYKGHSDANNPFCETILRKIGNTRYSIRTECGGTEPLTDKVKRLIFTDPMPEKTVWQG